MSEAIVRQPRILLPQCDLSKWAVVACDQFSSDKAYWERVAASVGDAPSALNLILPEAYLDDATVAAARQEAAVSAMERYCKSGLFAEHEGYVYVRRTFASGSVREGLMAAVDLERYDYAPDARPAIRATEGTVLSRIPPRVAIRERSLLELPHVMLLLDDPDEYVFGAVRAAAADTLYDFDLLAGGGHICGRKLRDAKAVEAAFERVHAKQRARFNEDVLLLVGDGNHSLAAAKACYENAKRRGGDVSRLRYALAEIVNIYDGGVPFLPIHRAVFGVRTNDFIAALQAAGSVHSALLHGHTECGDFSYGAPKDSVRAIAFVQAFCEDYVRKHGGSIDYIHGLDALQSLATRQNTVALPMPAVPKTGFTEYILRSGVLPKKSFSMGEAEEKRYYLEARFLRTPKE